MARATRTQITPQLLDDVRLLATKGTSTKMIAELVNVAYSTARSNKDIVATIQDGRNEARRKVIDLMDNLKESDIATLTATAKRLKIYVENLNIKKPETVEDALNIHGTFIKLYADGDIDQNQLRTMDASLNNFVKILEMTEIKKDLELIKKELSIRKIK